MRHRNYSVETIAGRGSSHNSIVVFYPAAFSHGKGVDLADGNIFPVHLPILFKVIPLPCEWLQRTHCERVGQQNNRRALHE